MLDKVTSGVIVEPHLVLIYGPDGVGKTTVAAQAPKPIFLEAEGGSNNLDVFRFPRLKTTAEASLAVKELIEKDHDFKSLVIDSVDWLETLLHQDICRQYSVKKIAEAAKGYGQGFVEALSWWQDFIMQLQELRTTRKMNIILLGHADIIVFNDPNTQATYERYQLKLHKGSSALLRQWVDCVLFANYKTFIKKEDKKTRAFGDGARVFLTERRPSHDAKNRKSLPYEIPLGWHDFDEAATVCKPSATNYLLQIEEILKEINDESLTKSAKEFSKKHKDNVVQLEQILNRLRIIVEKQG